MKTCKKKKVTHKQEIKQSKSTDSMMTKILETAKNRLLQNYYKYPSGFKENYGNNKRTDRKYQRNRNNGKGPGGNSRSKKKFLK